MHSPTESSSLSPAPDVVTDLAASCVRFVSQALGLELDYSQDTLPILDHYLSSGDDIEDEVLGLLAPACGAYFGEVVRRHVGEGDWSCPAGEYADWQLTLPSASMSFNPVGVAVEVATGEDAADWDAHFHVPPEDREAARDAVDRLGDVTAADYYTFSVRFEVLLQVFHALSRATADN